MQRCTPLDRLRCAPNLEPSSAARPVQPQFVQRATRIVAQLDEFVPLRFGCSDGGARDGRITAVSEFDLIPRPAVEARDQQHCAAIRTPVVPAKAATQCLALRKSDTGGVEAR